MINWIVTQLKSSASQNLKPISFKEWVDAIMGLNFAIKMMFVLFVIGVVFSFLG